MKVGIKKCMILLAGLLAAQTAFCMSKQELEARAKRTMATKFYNFGPSPIVVKGALGKSWTIPVSIPVTNERYVTFQTGLQENLVIERGIPPTQVLTFDLTNIKSHFASIDVVQYVPTGMFGSLTLYGRLRRNSAKRNEPKDEAWHLQQLRNYCSQHNCIVTKKETENYYYAINNIQPEPVNKGNQNFKQALEPVTRITHPTKFTNNATSLIQVKGALGLSSTIQPKQSESFQTGLQDSLQIKVKADSQPGKVNWKILEFNLKQIKEQFTWIKSAELVENQNYIQGAVAPEVVSNYTLSLNGILKRDAQSNVSKDRMVVLRSHCEYCAIGQEQDGTISVLGIQPKK